MKTIDKNIIWLGWVSFFTDMASSMITTLLPIFVVYVLHEGVDKLGIVIAVATFISYAFRILFGYLSDRLGIIKPFLVAGYLISAVAKPLLAFSSTYASVALLRGLERMGKAVRSAPKDVLISAYSRKNASGKTFGFHKMMDISGELVGALLILMFFMLMQKDEAFIRTLFAWTLIPGLIAAVIILFFVKDMPLKVKKKEVYDPSDRKLFTLLGIYFLFLLFLFSDQYLILKAKDEGFTLAQIPLFVIVFALTQSLTSYYSGVLIDRRGSGLMLLLSFLFGIASMVALALDFLWLSFIMLGLFTVISLNAMRAYISQEAQSKGAVFGIFYGGVAIFASLGALLIGYIWEHFGFESAVRLSIGGLTLLTLLLFLHLQRQRKLVVPEHSASQQGKEDF
ncbi:MFS transporter [Sulfurimonas sp. HSL3-7]|uniref:MFS transporter n=1 Tax=Sulfonitrofixus jiaomeiensis TaxID=3131938 RepID=UPI0031F76948